MRIIFNHTLRSIRQNKGEIVVIIATIVVVTAILFASLSLSDMFYNLSVSGQSRLASDNDISLDGDFFSVSRFEDYMHANSEKIEKYEYFFRSGGLVQTAKDAKVIAFEATNLQLLWDRYPQKLKIAEQADDYSYAAVWIGKDFAEDMGLKAGDIIEIYLDFVMRTEKFTVACIMENSGFFADNLVDNIFVDILDVNNQGLANAANIKLKNGTDAEAFSEGLQKHMKNDAVRVAPSIDYARAEEIMKSNSDLLNIGLILIIAMMFLILYTSYLVIAKKRLNEMVIFKAAGASPSQTTAIMLLEVILYGIVGAAAGVAIGRAGMGIAVKSIIPNFPNAVTYQWWKYLTAFLMGVFISASSAIFPILSVSRKSIRELTSGAVKGVRYINPVYLIVTSVLIIAGVVLVLVFDVSIVPVTLALILLFAFWIAGVVPYAVYFISRIAGKIRPARFSSVSIKRNSASHTLSVLVGSIITFSFFVYSVINLVVVAITPYNARYESDYVVCGTAGKESGLEQIKTELRKVSGVGAVYHIEKYTFEFFTEGDKKFDYELIGIDSHNALPLMTSGLSGGDIEKFTSVKNPVIINNDVALRFGIKIGDKFSASRKIAAASGERIQTVDTVYTVVAIEYSSTENDRVMYVYGSSIMSGGKRITPDNEMLFVLKNDTSNYEQLFLALRGTLERHKNVFVLKFNDWKFASTKGIEGVVLLFRFLQIIVSAVALIGIINLSIVTLLDRRKEFTIYRTSGMDGKRYGKLMFFEGIIVGLSGCMIGVALSFFINRLMSPFARLINKYMTFKIFPPEIAVVAAIGFAVYIILYWAIGMGNSKFLKKPVIYNERQN